MVQMKVINVPAGVDSVTFGTTFLPMDETFIEVPVGAYNLIINFNRDYTLVEPYGRLKLTYDTIPKDAYYKVADFLQDTEFYYRFFRSTTTSTAGVVYIFDLSEIVLTLNSEPEVGVKVYYTKSDDLEVSYTDMYGTPKTPTYLSEYDLVDLVVDDVLEIYSLNDKLIDTVTIQRNDPDYGSPLPAYVKQVNGDRTFIDLEDSMFSYGEVYFEVTLVTEPDPDPDPETITSNIEYLGANYTTSFAEATSVTTIKGEALTFTATAGSGYVFDGTSSTIEFKDIDYDTPLPHLEITVTQVGKTITITIPSDTLDYGVTIEINLNPTLAILPDVSSFINTYSVTSGELSQLATKRYAIVNGEVMDYGNRITSLFRLPFGIDSTTPDTIKLGDIDTEVSTHLVTDYLLRLPIGEVFVPEIYNNSLDYVNVKCTLYLPFLSSIELDSQQVINQTVSIEYVVNLFDGECTVNLYSSFTNQLFHSSSEKIGLDLPYSSGVNSHNPLFNIGSVKMNDIRLAYIEVERSVPSIVDNSLGVVVDEIGQLEDYVGYVEVANIDLHSKATISEVQEIKSLLRSGVYINE